jgi:folate-binding protein YgfZ
MAEAAYALLESRGVLSVAGPDRVGFLQGLVSNDVARIAPDRAIYAALLTAQGKYLHDFMMAARGDAILLDAEAARLADLQRRLGLYRLRAKVTIAASDSHGVAVAWGKDAAAAFGLPETPGTAKPFADGVAYVDPRLAALGVRLLLPRAGGAAPLAGLGLRQGDAAEYDLLRLLLGVPDGSRDLVVEKTILLEAGFDELNGIDWQKGCYIGQELTARTKYRGLVKKRLMPVGVAGPLPPPGTPVTRDDGEIGEMRSGRDGLALALLRLDAAESAGTLVAGGARITPIGSRQEVRR